MLFALNDLKLRGPPSWNLSEKWLGPVRAFKKPDRAANERLCIFNMKLCRTDPTVARVSPFLERGAGKFDFQPRPCKMTRPLTVQLVLGKACHSIHATLRAYHLWYLLSTNERLMT
jgi:hypothetical protein